MPTLNINGNIRTNTAAGWAADATVYSAKTILVTTDATYTGTDQRKFKIADGTQTWANLDYFPADIIYLSGTTKTVQQSDVIAQWIGATNRFSLTNDNNAYAKAWIFMTQTSASYGFNDAWLEAATGYLYLKASNVNMFSEPDGSRILSLDASKNIKGLDTATYPDLTELSYVKGVTSAIQTQLANKQPLDATLTALAGLSTSANKLIRATGSDTFELINGFSSTWTPTITNISNVAASTAYTCNYVHFNSTIFFWGKIEIDPTSAGVTTVLRISLPVASNFAAEEDAAGACNCQGVNQHFAIKGAVATDDLTFQGVPSSAANATYFFTGSYNIL